MTDAHTAALLTYLIIWVIVCAGFGVMMVIAKRGEEDEPMDVDDLDALIPERMRIYFDESAEFPPEALDKAIRLTARLEPADVRNPTRDIADGKIGLWWNDPATGFPIQSDVPTGDYRADDQGRVDDNSGGGGTMRGRRTGMLR